VVGSVEQQAVAAALSRGGQVQASALAAGQVLHLLRWRLRAKRGGRASSARVDLALAPYHQRDLCPLGELSKTERSHTSESRLIDVRELTDSPMQCPGVGLLRVRPESERRRVRCPRRSDR